MTVSITHTGENLETYHPAIETALPEVSCNELAFRGSCGSESTRVCQGRYETETGTETEYGDGEKGGERTMVSNQYQHGDHEIMKSSSHCAACRKLVVANRSGEKQKQKAKAKSKSKQNERRSNATAGGGA